MKFINNQNQFNKGISTPIGILIVLVFAILVGGVAIWQWQEIKEKVIAPEMKLPEKEIIKHTEKIEEKLNYDDLLGKMFPNKKFKNGEFEFKDIGIWLRLDKIIKDSFIKPDVKNLLFIVQMEGIAHAGGLYHAFLGVFDLAGNLLTLPIPDPIESHFGDSIFKGIGHFVSDKGNFIFYDCKGVKYILFESIGWTTGGASGGAHLIRIQDRKFQMIQSFWPLGDIETFIEGEKSSSKISNSDEIEIIVKAEKDKLVIYKKIEVEPDFECLLPSCYVPTDDIEGYISTHHHAFVYLTTFYWNKDSCRFEEKK